MSATSELRVPAAVAQAGRGARIRAVESPGERLANVATHAAGMLLAAAAWAAMQEEAARARTPGAAAIVAVFGATLLAVYAASTLYHAATAPRARLRLQRLDRAAIYLLVAGTYTPFCLLGVGGRLGWGLAAAEWSLAAAGIALLFTRSARSTGVSVALYLAMGWTALPFLGPVTAALGESCTAWLAAGGVAYTLGLAFFAARRPYTHAIWHLFVLAGSAAHVHAVLNFLLPRC
ncbi:MAG: hemolysin III family protein [Acidobacteria bacterium]|nr:hemolysin III family protein [Acidobacteriota bacterium]